MKVFAIQFICCAIMLLSFTACIKESSPILISGEFRKTQGTCTPYCYISIDDATLTLEGIDQSGSTNITYSEQYERSEDDVNRYYYFLNPDAYIDVIDEQNFTFSSSTRVCDFMQ